MASEPVLQQTESLAIECLFCKDRGTGADFIKRLFVDQNVFLTRDHRQTADQLARGNYPIALYLQEQSLSDLIKQGNLVVATRTHIARSNAGLAVKPGVPQPDMSTTEAFKKFGIL